MLYAGYSLKKSIDILFNYKKTLTNKTEVPKMKLRLDTELSLMYKMVNELLLTIQYEDSIKKSDLLLLKNTIDKALKSISLIKNSDDTADIIDTFATFKNINLGEINSYDLKTVVRDLIYNRSYQYSELHSIDVRTICDSINANRPFNVFSAIARTGSTLQEIKNRFEPDMVSLYALEEKDNNYATCKKFCDRTIKGTLTGARISNDVFDMMVLIPTISWEYSFNQMGALSERTEKAMFRHHIKHLRKDGIFVYCIPYSRLTKDIALMISKNLDNVKVIRRYDAALEQIIIIGTRNQTRDPKNDIYDYLSNVKLDDIDYRLDTKFNLPSGGIMLPDFFRGSCLDQDELQELINHSGLMNSFWEKTKVNNNKQSAKPLLPFNMGQIGLVLTSGCLDGVVEEFEGQYHAIKGMVTKIKHVDVNNDNNEEVNIETLSNKVQINIVTPDGQFIELA